MAEMEQDGGAGVGVGGGVPSPGVEHEQTHDDTESSVATSSTPSAVAAAAAIASAASGQWQPSARRCVSRELLEQMPTLSINTRYEEVSITKPFGVLHLMQLIERSIQVGALFTPRLYVPREIWQQDRVRLAGIPLKIELVQDLKNGLENITMALPLKSVESKPALISALDAFLEFSRAERVHLSRAFPFIPLDRAAVVAAPVKLESTNQIPGNVATAGIGKLTNFAVGFGRMVKKQAIAAVERVGAAQAVAVPIDELDEYAATLCTFFSSTTNLEHLFGLRGEEASNGEGATLHLDVDVRSRLEELAIFLDEVVVELVMRDIHTLLDALLRSTTQKFGEFTVEQALMKNHSSSLSA